MPGPNRKTHASDVPPVLSAADMGSRQSVIQDGRLIFRMGVVNDLLTCSLCNGYFRLPLSVMECLHTFCQSCILKHVENSRRPCTCPTCGISLGPSPMTMMRVDRVREALLEQLVPGHLHADHVREREFYQSGLAQHPEWKALIPEARQMPVTSARLLPAKPLGDAASTSSSSSSSSASASVSAPAAGAPPPPPPPLRASSSSASTSNTAAKAAPAPAPPAPPTQSQQAPPSSSQTSSSSGKNANALVGSKRPSSQARLAAESAKRAAAPGELDHVRWYALHDDGNGTIRVAFALKGSPADTPTAFKAKANMALGRILDKFQASMEARSNRPVSIAVDAADRPKLLHTLLDKYGSQPPFSYVFSAYPDEAFDSDDYA